MTPFQMPEWAEMFVPDHSVFDSFARGTFIYFSVLILFRIIPRRQVGSVAMTDILLLVLVSECVSNALYVQAKSITNGLVSLLALIFWNYVLDWLADRVPFLQRIMSPKPVPLIEEGKALEEKMKQESICLDELLSQLRLQGVDDIRLVKSAFIEPDGSVSVIRKE